MEYDFFSHKTTAFTHTMYFFKIQRIGKTPAQAHKQTYSDSRQNSCSCLGCQWHS